MYNVNSYIDPGGIRYSEHTDLHIVDFWNFLSLQTDITCSVKIVSFTMVKRTPYVHANPNYKQFNAQERWVLKVNSVACNMVKSYKNVEKIPEYE